MLFSFCHLLLLWVQCNKRPSSQTFLLSFTPYGTSFTVTRLGSVFIMAFARTFHAIWVVGISLFIYQTSANALQRKGDFSSVSFFLLLHKISHGYNAEPELCAKTYNKDFTGVSEGNPLFLDTENCSSVNVLGVGTEICCMVHHPRRHLCFSITPLGFLEALCQQDIFFSFPIHSHNDPREVLQTPKALHLPNEHGPRVPAFLSLMPALLCLEGTWMDALPASRHLIRIELVLSKKGEGWDSSSLWEILLFL